ncbi:NUDIX hydrolase [Streptomyces sp. CA-111067]|uniref:NUDIX hydrolase n=1 Tax=Streptomyces sp. CA-111067 TaxID=3240046 RepID=UPI003D96D4FA
MKVEFSGDRLLLESHEDDAGPYYAFPGEAEAATVPVDRQQAVNARVRPLGTAEAVLAAWSRGERTTGWVPKDDPTSPPPERRRGGAVVVRDGRILLIRYAPKDGDKFFIPGGGVEAGETPSQAAVRELEEETGLLGHVERPLAVVYNRGREEHYFLLSVAPEPAQPARGDLAPGQTLGWHEVAALPDTPVWPKRLAWRIAQWHATGWPAEPVVLADSSGELDAPCTW